MSCAYDFVLRRFSDAHLLGSKGSEPVVDGQVWVCSGRTRNELQWLRAVWTLLLKDIPTEASAAVVTDAKGQKAVDFYKKYGFIGLLKTELRLFLPMASMVALFKNLRSRSRLRSALSTRAVVFTSARMGRRFSRSSTSSFSATDCSCWTSPRPRFLRNGNWDFLF